MLPTVPADELARRLHLTYPGGPLDPQLEQACDIAGAMHEGHVDESIVNAKLSLWAEAVYALAVKVWDIGTKGATAMDAVGEFDFPAPSAYAGLLNSTAAYWHPLTLTGGNVIA